MRLQQPGWSGLLPVATQAAWAADRTVRIFEALASVMEHFLRGYLGVFCDPLFPLRFALQFLMIHSQAAGTLARRAGVAAFVDAADPPASPSVASADHRSHRRAIAVQVTWFAALAR